MKRVIVKYGCGYGRHEIEFEIKDDATNEEIEEAAREAALDKFDWSYTVELVSPQSTR